MKNVLTLRNLVAALPVLILLASLHYALPQVDVVKAIGVEIKRIDISEADAEQPRTRDVYFLQTETLGGKPSVYRNEDNFIYGKFDSADLQAQVQSLAAGKRLLALRHYGWRVRLFSIFPNAIKAWPVQEGYRHIPVFNLIVLTIFAGLTTLGFRKVRRVSASKTEIRQAREAEQIERDALRAREAGAAADRRRREQSSKQADIDSFLNTNNRKAD